RPASEELFAGEIHDLAPGSRPSTQAVADPKPMKLAQHRTARQAEFDADVGRRYAALPQPRERLDPLRRPSHPHHAPPIASPPGDRLHRPHLRALRISDGDREQPLALAIARAGAGAVAVIDDLGIELLDALNIVIAAWIEAQSDRALAVGRQGGSLPLPPLGSWPLPFSGFATTVAFSDFSSSTGLALPNTTVGSPRSASTRDRSAGSIFSPSSISTLAAGILACGNSRGQICVQNRDSLASLSLIQATNLSLPPISRAASAMIHRTARLNRFRAPALRPPVRALPLSNGRPRFLSTVNSATMRPCFFKDYSKTFCDLFQRRFMQCA